MNFTYKLRRPLDGQWGSLKDNGQWTGMIKELLLKEADIGMSNTFHTWHISLTTKIFFF